MELKRSGIYKTIEMETTKIQARKNSGYLWMNLLLLIILPVFSVAGECFFEHESFGWQLVGKWFIFWVVGIRLFTAGISQASNPGFTARIFKMKTQESFIVIRELGFANISLGVMGILSVINNDWRLLAAIGGGLFLGIAGIQHLFKKPDSQNEFIAMFYDLTALLIIFLYLVFTLYQ
jgi:hypothetical protein